MYVVDGEVDIGPALAEREEDAVWLVASYNDRSALASRRDLNASQYTNLPSPTLVADGAQPVERTAPRR